jgi:hypothetical protein
MFTHNQLARASADRQTGSWVRHSSKDARIYVARLERQREQAAKRARRANRRTMGGAEMVLYVVVGVILVLGPLIAL